MRATTSDVGTFAKCRRVRDVVAIRWKADVAGHRVSVAFDPLQTSERGR
jgi:hypothetical protein